jgi:hypothetical protein
MANWEFDMLTMRHMRLTAGAGPGSIPSRI